MNRLTGGKKISRRAFAGRTLAAVVAASAVGSCARQAARRPSWKTAVGLNGFESSARKHNKVYPLEDVLRFASEEGFDGIELVERWAAAGWTRYPDPDDLPAIRALRSPADRNGLQIFSIQIGTAEAFDPNADVRKAWLETFRKRADLARALDCEWIGMWPGGGLRGQTMAEAVARLAESYGQAREIAAARNLGVAFEIEPPFVFNTEAHLRQILLASAAANGPSADSSGAGVRFIYDPSHFDLMNGSRGRPHEMLERLLEIGRVGYVHLTDTDGTLRDGGTSKHLACGDGHANIPASLAVLKSSGFEGWIMIDAWEIPDPYDACRKGKRMIEAARAS